MKWYSTISLLYSSRPSSFISLQLNRTNSSASNMKFHSSSRCLWTFVVLTLNNLILIQSQSAVSQHHLPNFLKKCHRNDPNLSECLKGTIESMRPKIADGIPELLIPPCEPLQIPEIRIKQNSGAIRMESVYSDINVTGLSNFTLRRCTVDMEKNRIVVDFWFPSLEMTAKYHLHGKILLMPLTGNGTINGNFSDIDAAVSMEHNIITKMDNRKHLDVSDVKVELNIGSASVNLDNLFNGDAELGSMMNRFLNDNWREITAEIRPALAESTQHILRGMANRLTEMYSIDQFLPE